MACSGLFRLVQVCSGLLRFVQVCSSSPGMCAQLRHSECFKGGNSNVECTFADANDYEAPRFASLKLQNEPDKLRPGCGDVPRSSHNKPLSLANAL